MTREELVLKTADALLGKADFDDTDHRLDCARAVLDVVVPAVLVAAAVVAAEECPCPFPVPCQHCAYVAVRVRSLSDKLVKP